MDLVMEILLVIAVLILSLISDTECDNVSCGKIDRPNMKFILRGKGRYARFRCIKGFELLGHANAVCQTSGAWSVDIPRCIGPTCTPIPDSPGLVVESLMSGALLKFSCSAGMVRDGADSIFCEDNKWNSKPPVCKEGMSMGCDFESGFCGWSDDTSDDFDWMRNRGETPTADTGPQFDHTTNSANGHYLFAESSSPQEAGKKARLISPIYKPESVVGLCLEFYYHMFGPDGDGQVGQLDVYIKPKELSTKTLTFKQQVFHKEGNQGDQWIKQDFELPDEKEPFQIVFQATILNSWTSDIAIDDIRLHKCKEASSGTTVLTTKVTPKRKPLVNGTSTARTASMVIASPSTTIGVTTNRPSTAMKSTTRATTVTTATMTTSTTTTPKPTTTTTKPTTTTPKPTTTTPRPTTTTPKPTTTTLKPTTTSTSTRPTTTSVTPTTTTAKTSSTTTPISSTSSAETTTRVQTATTTTKTTTPATTQHLARDTSTSSSVSDKATSATATQTTTTNSDDQDDNTTDDSINPDDDDKPDNTDDGDGDEDEGEEEIDETSDIDTNSTVPDYIDNGITNAHHSFETDDNGTHSSPVVDYDRRYKPGDTKNGGTDATTIGDGSEAKAGSVKEGQEGSGTKELLPLIIGVVASVVVGAIVIAGLAYMWARNQRRKREKEEDDQMNIITEYVETTLNV